MGFRIVTEPIDRWPLAPTVERKRAAVAGPA